MPIFLDVLIVAVLLLYIALGAHRGFVLTLCSLVAVVVAFVGASILSDAAAPKVAEFLQPHIEQTVQEVLDDQLQQAADSQRELLADDLFDALEEKGGIYAWTAKQVRAIPGMGDPHVPDAVADAAATAAAAVAQRIAHAVLFLVAFLVVLIAWAVLSHALDLVAKLPVLTDLNRALGGAMGFVKGLVIVYLAAWVLVHLTGSISPETVSATKILKFLTEHSPLDLLLLV